MDESENGREYVTACQLMSITVSVRFNAVRVEDGKETPVLEEWASCLPVRDFEEREEASILLQDLSEAIEAGNLYGWMTQQIMQCHLDAGDIRSETDEELITRVIDDAKNLVPGATVTSA